MSGPESAEPPHRPNGLAANAPAAATAVVPARAGLVGNPSDGYGGAVLAIPVTALAASVTVTVAAAAPGDEH